MFILLPLSQTGLPKDMEEKKQIIRYIQDSTTGDMAKERVHHTVEMMSKQNHMF